MKVLGGRTGTAMLVAVVLLMGAFLTLSGLWDKTPEETFSRLTGQTDRASAVSSSSWLSLDNSGILTRPQKAPPGMLGLSYCRFVAVLTDVMGIKIGAPRNLGLALSGFTVVDTASVSEDVKCEVVQFISHDGLGVPVYRLRPHGIRQDSTLPAVLLFSGHGSAAQAAYDSSSYQRGAGADLARAGFVVFVMENRGMGRLEHLGDHQRIDAVARLTGGCWYGEIVTDALYLLANVLEEPYVDGRRIGAAGVSTGGALSMFVAAFDNRIAATYVQGFLGSFKTTFGKAGRHCLCGHIPGILRVGDMADIASLIAPRPVCFVNGSEDTFLSADARAAFVTIDAAYMVRGAGGEAELLTPEGVGHELSVELAVPWLSKQLQ